MVQTKIEHFIIFFFLCFHARFPVTAANTSNERPTGFSLELIHREFSERSPYYSANLTDSEYYQRVVQLSKARLQWLKYSSSEKSINLTAIRPPVVQTSNVYLVSMRVGTGRAMQEYLLELDTGSELTWIQCEPCKKCYKQLAPKFQPNISPTYRPIPCNDPLCRYDMGFKCINNICKYLSEYRDKSIVQSDFSRETFAFLGLSGGSNFVSVPNLAFGCSHHNEMKIFDPKAAGIVGMNGRPESFAVQLANITGNIFSYCLVPMGHQGHTGYIRFGKDIPMKWPMQMTPLEILQHNGRYYVTLVGISLANRRLNLDQKLFRRTSSENGVFVDSGCSTTFLVTPAFQQALTALHDYFRSYNVSPTGKTGVCFKKRSSIDQVLPSLTFHLQGADLMVPGMYMFYYNSKKEVYCWNLANGGGMTVIGATQQVNHRISFDLSKKMMYVAPEDCSRDAMNIIN